jgi:hypothetical protein
MQIPDNLSAQSDLMGAPEPMSIEAVLAAPNSGSARVLLELLDHSVWSRLT